MNFSTLLCLLFSKLDGEKTVNAGYHLLRGKRSGQTIQDVKYYQLQMFFGILPKLSKDVFEEGINQLIASNYIMIDEKSILHLTEKGKALIQAARPYEFDGWHYRGREELFFARLSLIVQTLSHFRVGVKRFHPVQGDAEIQQFVKRFLSDKPFQDPVFAQQLKKELEEALQKSNMEELQKNVFVYRLIGYRQTGWTWQQMSEQLNISPIDIKLNYIEGLHKLLHAIEKEENSRLLKQIAKGIKVEILLTDSTRRTKTYFDRGYTLEEIAIFRQLKLSTIEDHIVEIAMNDAKFPLVRFVDMEAYELVQQRSVALGTKRLRALKEEFQQLTYFQLRLILSIPMKEGLK